MQPKIIILYCSFGGGHYVPSKTLAQALQMEYPDFLIDLVDPYEYFPKKMDWCRKIIGISSRDFYNKIILQKHFYFLANLSLTMSFLAKRWQSKKIIQQLVQLFENKNPSLVVSCMPYINTEVFCALQAIDVNVPLIICPTDFDEIHREGWLTVPDAYYFCSTEALYQKARVLNSSKACLLPGLILRKGFAVQSLQCKQKSREHLNLPQGKPVVLIQFGGYGGSQISLLIEKIVQKIDCHLIAITGKNVKLYEKLEKKFSGFRQVLLLGYTEDISLYVKAADIMIGKPGANSVAEAVVALTPIIFLMPYGMMPQEIHVAELCLKNKIAVICKSIRAVVDTLVNKIPELEAWQQKCIGLMSSGLDEAVTNITHIINAK